MVLTSPGGHGAAGAVTALWCVPVAERGGVARHVLDATSAGVPGTRVVVLCPEGPLAAELRARGQAVLTGPVSPADGPRAAVAAIRRTLRALRPDVLHTHLAFADLTGVAAVRGLRSARGRRIRLVTTEHGISGVAGYYQSGRASATAKALAHRARLRATDAVIAVSSSTAQQLREQWGAQRIRVIRNGVDAPAVAPAPAPGLRVLSLARLSPEKRIDALLRAFALVAAEHEQATLTIAGAGPEEQTLRALVEELGLTGRVDLPGHLDAEQALVRHDVVAQLSVWENLSYTLLDAVAHGLGAVATDVGGNAEIVPPACLVDAEDPADVAAAIVRQGLDPAARPVPGTAQGVEAMCAGIATVYGEVLR
ncbi:glycosyltransferase [Brachybacterium sp. NBEC-018]|uniref:glycosyltransferase n=1 Tax=Brachybacterium sp. NBEC-018 TaxID=2996004 RepID=UPI0021754D2D|nr:glycosyltransferase [Brachybacterium sp. NBEC-018]UVY84834.1 glycosyltransferase [Brachybacterium sp. NBEC-018]